MAISAPRGQRGITLIEIILVCAIVAAAAIGLFVFAKKARVTAAVETEQRQVQSVVQIVEGLFATQPNFAALGTDGASYLKAHAARAGLTLGQDADGNPALLTGLGHGTGTLTLATAQVSSSAADPGVPNNGFVMAYQGLTAAECIGLVTSTAAYTTKTHVGTGAVAPTDDASRVALRGQLVEDKSAISAACSSASGTTPSVFLFFAPARAITTTATAAPPAAARCQPFHETQQTACPTGQVGTITQGRDGACTGPGNALVYTAWTTTDNTCQDEAVTPPTVTPAPAPDNCALVTATRVQACPSGQIGQEVQQSQQDTCAGTSTPWTTISDSCQAPPPAGTCTPSTETRPQPCPAGLIGAIDQVRSSKCDSPSSVPEWIVDYPDRTDINGWETFSNTCSAITSTCVSDGTCCVVQRDTRTTNDPCPAGTYGNTSQQQEAFLGCVNATTQAAAWTPWQTVTGAGSCTTCPASAIEPETIWDNRSTSCPAGYTGSKTWQAEQVRTRTVSYSCPAGTTTLPSPTTSTWGPYVDTGATRNAVDTCVAGGPANVLVAGYFGSDLTGWWFDATDTTIDIYQHGINALSGGGPYLNFLGACAGPYSYPDPAGRNAYNVCVVDPFPPAGSASCTIPAGTSYQWHEWPTTNLPTYQCSGTVPTTTTVPSGGYLIVQGTVFSTGTPSHGGASNKAEFLCTDGKLVQIPSFSACF